MTAIEHYQPTNELATQDMAVRRLGEWAQSAEAAHHIAQTLVRTAFVPDAFKNKPDEATAAILAGLEVGLQPMAALRSFDVIQGQAAPRAITLRAIVQSKGHEMILEESTASRCKMRGRRKGEGEWQTVTWTTDRAKSLNLMGKPNWRSQPQAMLVARATSELARLIAADAILGIGYSVEEITDGAGAGVDVTDTIVANATTDDPGKRRMSRKKPADTPAEPLALTDTVEDAEVIAPPTDPGAVTEAQITKMIVAFKEQNIVDRDDRLNYIASVINRQVASSKELTKAEASTVIDMLERSTEDPT